MENVKPGLPPSETQKIRLGLEQCIKTLDNNRHLLGDVELRMRRQLVQVHAQIEKIDIDSQHPFTKAG